MASASRPSEATYRGLRILFFSNARRTFITSTSSSSTRRMCSTLSSGIVRAFFFDQFRPEKMARSTTAFVLMHTDLAAERFDDLLDERHADAHILHFVPLLERLKAFPASGS